MKIKFYLACTLVLSLGSCQKQLLTATEPTSQFRLKNIGASLKESDGFFTNGYPPDTSYHMQFTDRFYTNNIDANGEGWWTSRSGSVLYNSFTGYNRPANDSISLSDNKLNINFNQDPDGKYYGGGIISKKTFGYGYYEARIKLYTGSYGLHQSFWSFATPIEIDGSETDSKIPVGYSTYHPGRHKWKPTHIFYVPNTTEKSNFVQVPYTNVSSPTQGNNGVWTDTSGTWHTVGYEWLPDRVNYYIDGVKNTTYGLVDSFGDSVNVFQPANVELTALPYKASPTVNMVTPQVHAAMQVEYFAYYEKRLLNTNLLGNSQFSYVNNVNDVTESTATGWNNSPLVVNGVTTYGNTASDNANSYVVKDGGNWYLEQKNTSQAYKAETYQTLYFVLPGTYTFSSDIRCSGAGAKFIVLDKDKTTVLYSRTIIGPHSDWIHISDNIPVTNDEVTILVYSDVAQGAWLNVDNINFSLNR